MSICNLFAPLLAPSIYVGDTGTALTVVAVDELNVPVNISTATVLDIYLTMPTGVVLTKVGVLDTNGVDGRIRYTTLAGDLSVAGTWVIQGRATVGTATWATKASRFLVLALGK